MAGLTKFLIDPSDNEDLDFLGNIATGNEKLIHIYVWFRINHFELFWDFVPIFVFLDMFTIEIIQSFEKSH